MARRGDKLREHILLIAKHIFLEMGFERTSMDVVAIRSETSKRSVYAHFESKEKLFLSVLDEVRSRFLKGVRKPAEYSDKPIDALTLFCGRFLEILLYKPSIQMIRISLAEADQFPKETSQYFDQIFTEVENRIDTYLVLTFKISPQLGRESSQRLIGQILFPRFERALFGLDELAEDFDREAMVPDLDLKPIRKVVSDMIAHFRKAS